ncbi:MAG: glycosyltransferase family 2 protein [Ilumatobacteraceae bacterium]
MPSVTIVMRTYERPVFLARALASVCGQTFADWELVVVNNGGAPQQVDHLVRLAHLAHPGADIRVMHLPERVGMEEASNSALRQTSSEFFVIHDDDDTWKPRFLDVAVSEIRKHPTASAVVTGVVRVHETFKNGRVWPVENEMFYLTQERLTIPGMIGNNTFPPIAALFRRSAMDKVGEFDSSLPVLGDWEFNLRALTVGDFVFMPERLANYHTRTPDSDVAAGNSITVGQNLHQEMKKQLQQRWDSEPGDGGVSKGEMSRRAYAQMEADDASRIASEEAQRQSQRSLGAQIRRARGIVRAPQRLVRGVVRRIRVKVGR